MRQTGTRTALQALTTSARHNSHHTLWLVEDICKIFACFDPMKRRAALIGAPTSAGAYAPGQEKAPAAFRTYGLLDGIGRAGWDVRDAGDVAGFRWRSDPQNPKAMNVEAVLRIAKSLADRVENALHAREIALVLGGDCTIELGSVAGALRGGMSVGLLYIDLDTDLNPPANSDGALDWTGVAHLLDLEGAAPELSAIGPRRPMLSDRDILYFAADLATQTPSERSTMETRGLSAIELNDVHRDPPAAVQRAVAWGKSFDRLAVHLDVDVLSFTAFPIAENVRRRDGLTLPELSTIIGGVFTATNLATLTITEVNPDHAPDEANAFVALIAMLTQAMAKVV
jgi:arginase